MNSLGAHIGTFSKSREGVTGSEHNGGNPRFGPSDRLGVSRRDCEKLMFDPHAQEYAQYLSQNQC